ncbi:hypothetical protein BDV18DRAFT_166932 [Aspergillus unguis]
MPICIQGVTARLPDWSYRSDIDITDWSNIISASNDINSTACPYSLDTDNILVILRTGATEILDKVGVHLDTTLQCVQYYAIFSDFEEDFLGVHVHDVLRSVNEENRKTDPDFGIYNRLRTSGREGLVTDDWKDDVNGPLGKPGNPGWKLDKWKFAPMVDEALLIRPDSQWFIFMEADTYIIWRNMVRWLSRLDHTKAHYLGAPMQMGKEIFAYGGAGIVLSRSAMKLVSQYRAENFTTVEQMTADDWAGDHVLGRILIEQGIPLAWGWPSLNPSNVWEFEYLTPGLGRRPWCYPAVSFHHMSPRDIREMWLFKKQWLRFIYQWRIHDVMKLMKVDWDNLSSDQQPQNGIDSPKTIAECMKRCSLITDCLQYSYSNEGCRVSEKVIGGSHRQGFQSGWMEDRVKALVKSAGGCQKVQYVTG